MDPICLQYHLTLGVLNYFYCIYLGFFFKIGFCSAGQDGLYLAIFSLTFLNAKIICTTKPLTPFKVVSPEFSSFKKMLKHSV